MFKAPSEGWMAGAEEHADRACADRAYRAFISYSHADRAFAQSLHRKLEGYRFPKGLADAQALSPIFLDRAELVAGDDLSGQVRAALGHSAALIVVASPHARASRWVGLEIDLFRSLHPHGAIFVALIDGEPQASFPLALLHRADGPAEPIAADFRPHADGPRLALIKLAAGLAGLPLDRLVQRDAQARHRRVMAVTAGALALSMVLATLLLIALSARAEAERQRSEAEGMVEFMLTDLRDRLQGVGRLDVMDAVNERAMAHYGRQELDSLPGDSLNRRARLLMAMGDNDERRGRFPAALAKYQEARRTTGAVLAQHPDDPDAIFAHAQSEYWVGSAAWEQGDLRTTEQHWRGYLAQAEALARAEPGSVRSLLELGYAHGNMCELTGRSTGKPAMALPYCQASTRYMRQAAGKPGAGTKARLELANRIGWQADLLLKSGDLAAARSLRSEETDIVAALLQADPANRQLQERRLWPEIGLAEIELASANPEPGFVRVRRCLGAYRQLAAARPDDRQITVQQMRLAWLAASAAQHGHHAEMAEFTAMARTSHQLLRQSFPPREMTRFDAMLAQLNTGESQ